MLTHSDLCVLSGKWLQRYSNGCSCDTFLIECKTGISGEVVDAIGFKSNPDNTVTSILVEAKASRSDFLADKNKPHRKNSALGVGDLRYYIAPKGLISKDDLPDRWGLIEVSGKSRLLVKCGYHAKDNTLSLQSWLFPEKNLMGEQYLMTRVLANIDPQKQLDRERGYNQTIRNYQLHLNNISRKIGLYNNAPAYMIDNEIERLLVERDQMKEEIQRLKNHLKLLA